MIGIGVDRSDQIFLSGPPTAATIRRAKLAAHRVRGRIAGQSSARVGKTSRHAKSVAPDGVVSKTIGRHAQNPGVWMLSASAVGYLFPALECMI